MKEGSVFDKKYYCKMKVGQQFSENTAIGLSFYLQAMPGYSQRNNENGERNTSVSAVEKY